MFNDFSIMRYIANIVTSSKKTKYNIFYKICKNISEIDKALPTLVVGVGNAKQSFGDDLNYINRKIDEKTFWTYKITEKRSSYENDLEKFNLLVSKEFKNSINYKYINLLTSSLSIKKRLLSFLSENDVWYYVTNNMIYISYGENVLGISLDECEYLGIKKEKIFNKLKKHTQNIMSSNRLLFDNELFINDNIMTSAMFCYLNT